MTHTQYAAEVDRLRKYVSDLRNYLRDMKVGEMEFIQGFGLDRSEIDRFVEDWDANTNKILYGEEPE